MLLTDPLQVSNLMLSLLGTQVSTLYRDRVPTQGSVLVVSNHRSFLDAPLLMAAMGRPVRFACHHYMGQVPVLREFVTRLGCFPLDAPEQRQHRFFQQAIALLQNQQVVGIFPEGADPMVRPTSPLAVGDFQRGFAHLALRAPLDELAILPVAIVSEQEANSAALPLQLFGLFDPSEPLFNQPGWHPMVMYRQVNLLIGQPFWVQPAHRADYQGKQARAIVNHLTDTCRSEIDQLLRQGWW
jgi:1-acyl-sn-glycerol-3-phosphate acyltransferase